MRSGLAFSSTLVAIALGWIVCPSLALASGCEAEASTIAAHIFDMSDSDADGFLSPAEFADAGLERYGLPFDEYDENGDGVASVDEYFDVFERHHPPRGVI